MYFIWHIAYQKADQVFVPAFDPAADDIISFPARGAVKGLELHRANNVNVSSGIRMLRGFVHDILQRFNIYPDRRRRTYIKPHQLKAWYDAVNNLPNRTYRDYLLFVLFTGLRRREAASLRWTQVDFAGKLLSITDTKNGDPLTLPLSDFVLNLLLERKKVTGDKPFIFPGFGKQGYFAEPKKGVAAVIEAMALTYIIGHDLSDRRY